MRFDAWYGLLGLLIAVILTCSTKPLCAQETVDLSSVSVKEQQGRGVKSVVIRRKHSGHEIQLRKRTNQEGMLDLDPFITCEYDEMIRAIPESYLRYKPIVPKKVETNVELVAAIRISGEEALSQRVSAPADAGKRVLYFTHQAARSRSEGSEGAVYAEQWAFLSAAELFNIEIAMYFDKNQGKVVASKELVDAIENYQRRGNLSVTRQLDSQTVEALAGVPFWAVMYGIDSESGTSQAAPKLALTDDFVERVSGLGDPQLSMLAINATRAKLTGQSGLAALLFNEATIRLRSIGSDAARQLAAVTEVEMFQSMGDALVVEDPARYDPVQGKYVISPSLSDELERFQLNVGLEATGMADYLGLRSLAGGDNVGYYLTGVRLAEP